MKKDKPNKINVGDKIGGFYVSSPWDEDVPLLIEEAIVREFEGVLWAEHIKPQYDYTEITEPDKWIDKRLK